MRLHRATFDVPVTMDSTPDTGHDESEGAAHLTARQAAELIGVNERTVRRAIASGALRAVKRHGVFVIAVPDLETWRGSRRREAELGGAAALPRPLTTLVGRDREVEAGLALVRRSDVPLVTLTGPGGIGKTRLGLAIAAAASHDFAGGVWFVPLAGVSEPGQVSATIAQVLGLPGSANLSRKVVLQAFLRRMEALLVLDNFEHVTDAAPDMAELLGACPGVTMLVTSRSLLRVSGEHALPVPPLDVDEPSGSPGGEPATRLFVDRARAADPSFTLTEDTAPIAADICRLLDGLPLAIELAPARVTSLPLPVLRERLDRRLSLLTRGSRDAPPRHRTMRDAIAWSHDLLSEDERCVLHHLAVFAGGFTVSAAEYVIGHGGTRAYETADVVASLLDKSLLGRDGDRIGMLETIRQYAQEQLAVQNELDGALEPLAEWCLALAEDNVMVAYMAGGEQRLALLEQEQANLRQALEWLYLQHDGQRLLHLASALGGFWYERSHYREGRLWMERALSLGEAGDPLDRGNAMVHLGFFLRLLEERAHAGVLAAEGVALLRTGEDAGALAAALIRQGAIAMQDGAYEEAQEMLNEVLALAGGMPDEVLATALAARAMSNLGAASRAIGDLGEATRWHELALQLCREQGYLLGISRCHCDLAIAARDQGDHVRSLACYRESLTPLGERTDLRIVKGSLVGATAISIAWGQGERAALLLGATAGLDDILGVSLLLPGERLGQGGTLQAVRAMVGHDRCDDLFAAGRRLAVAEAIAEVMAMSPPMGEGQTLPAPSDMIGILTPREEVVLHLLAEGLRDREIADRLFISPRTVEGHVTRILTKLDVPTRAAAVRAAIQLGIMDADQSMSS